MSEAIRVLHFADIHIGMENYGKTDDKTGLSSRVLDFLHRMDEMIDYARENEVDLTIFAGDAFKTRTPNPTYQREFAHRIQDLAELAPVVLLVGNHDLQPNSLKASSIEIYDTLRVSNVIVAQEYEIHEIETRRGKVIVGTAPYPVRARLMQHVNSRGMSIRELDDQLEASLVNILEGLADDADTRDPDNTTPRLLTGHFTVRGAMLGSERSVMLGRDVQVSPSLLADPRWDYVALGHIHKHQNLTAGQENMPPVVYSGSLECIDFGEEHDVKGYCWLQLQRNQTEWQHHPVKARRMKTLKYDCRKDKLPTQTIIRDIKTQSLDGAIVRLIVQLSPETDTVMNDGKIRDALKAVGVFHIASIRRDVEHTDRARLGTNPESLTHPQLLEHYFISKEVDKIRREELLDAADEVMNPE